MMPFAAWRLIAAAGLAVGLALGTPRAVSAECDGPAVSFRDRASEAPLVVIGDVSTTEPDASEHDELGRASQFTLQVRYVLQGEASSSIHLRDTPSGPCSGNILARAGDRIALALGLTDKLLFGEKSWAAVAWIRGTPLEYEGVERTTVAKAFRFLGLEPPETSTNPSLPGHASLSAWIALLGGLVAAAATLLVTRRPRRIE